jgi:hypothetical protein
VSADREDEALAAAREIDEAEERIRKEIEAGWRLDEARKKYRYFQLQSRV